MAYDFKKTFRPLYLPKEQPSLVEVPRFRYLAVRGSGDPNTEGGAYQQSIAQLYGVAYTIKMSKKTDHRMEGYFDFVVPPLEGFWHQEGVDGVDYTRKEDFQFVSVLHMPDFVTEEEVQWAVREAERKKKSTVPLWSSSPWRRACACSACTSAPTTTSPPQWRGCTHTWSGRAVCWISALSGSTMKSTSATRAKRRRRSGKRSSATRSGGGKRAAGFPIWGILPLFCAFVLISLLLPPQGLNGVHPRRLVGGQQAEHHADEHGEHHSQHAGRDAHRHRRLRQAADDLGHDDARNHAQNPAQAGEHGRLGEELEQNPALLGADGLLQADFPVSAP